MTESKGIERRFVVGSALLQELHNGAPAGHFTLQWLMSSLRKHSYPGVIFFFAVLAVVPGISAPAGLVLLALAIQNIARRPMPTFPRWIASRPLPTDKLSISLSRAIPVLRVIENAIYPRWPVVLAAARRIVGLVIFLLTVRLLAWPLPLSNMVPAAVISFIALSDLEEDGLMLALALGTGIIVIGVDTKVLYDVVQGLLKSISGGPPALNCRTCPTLACLCAVTAPARRRRVRPGGPPTMPRARSGG